jgi:protein-S-isoprenylcysteine O-methyltransferase Ste14
MKPVPGGHQPDASASQRRSFLEKGGAWVVAQFVAMACWMALTPIGHRRTDSVAILMIAAALLVAGAYAGIAGAVALGKSRTPFPMPPEDTRLIRSGIYSFVRHPLYASLIALSLAWACYWESPAGGALAVVQALLLDAKARREERWLREKFPGYADYAAKVKRLIPFIY